MSKFGGLGCLLHLLQGHKNESTGIRRIKSLCKVVP